MRLALFAAALAVIVSGCLFEPGLGSSTRNCDVSQPVADGVRINITDPTGFVGYCMGLHGDGIEGKPLAKITAEGVVWFALPGAGSYYGTVSVQAADDKYCADTMDAFFEYHGTGVLQVEAERARVCS